MRKFCYIAISLKYCDNRKAKRAGFILPVLLFLNVLSAQAQYFNKRIDFMGLNQAENGFSLEKMDNGNYLVFNSARPEAGDNLGLGRTILSPEGTILEELVYFDDITVLYTGHSNTSFKLSDGGLVSSGSRSWFSGIESLISLSRYSETGELDWIRFYGDSTNMSAGNAATQHYNKNLASVGWKHVQGPNLTMGFLLITDSLGEELSLTEYGGSLADHFYSVFPTFDGGYILGGYTQSYGTAGKWDHFLVKTDSAGNQEWMRAIGSPRDDCRASVIQTLDSNFVFCGCWNYYNDGSPSNPYTRPYIAKLNQDGEDIWDQEYMDQPYFFANLRVVKEMPDGHLIGAGFYNNGESGIILKTDAEGNEIWMRSITHPTISPNGVQLIYDIIPEDDGGIVGTGWMFSPPWDSLPGQDLWVFRTDSMGCLVPGCHIVDNVEVHEEEVLVCMFPNPVQDLLSVHLKSGPMPRGAELELYDMHGRRHTTTTVNPGATTYILPMGHLPAGMYLLRCVTGGEVVWSGKVLKE